MAKIKLNGDSSGYIEISAPAVSYNNTLELGPGTKILTNLDNTFTGVSTFSSDVYLGNDIYLKDGIGGYEKVEVGANDIRVGSKHIHSEFGVWTRSYSLSDRRNGFDGDGNNLRLYSNSTEKVRITAAGNVGIASVTPAARLDVYKDFGGIGAGTYAGRVYGTDTGVNETGVRFVTKGTGDLHNVSDAYLMHGISNGTTRFVFGANGNIGIGENTPETLLHLSKNGGQATITLEDPSNSMKATLSAGTTRLDIGTPGSHAISFFTNNAHRLRIDSSGHLLHGVTADEDTSGNGGLRFINAGDIQIDGDQKALVFRSTNNTAQLQSAIEWWNENGAGVQTKIACDRTAVSQAPSDLVFYTSSNVDLGGAGNDGAITERLRITSGGNIGINCNSPGSMLELNAAAGTKMGISLGAVGDNITASRYIGICKSADQTDLGANSGFQGIEFGGPSSTNEGYLAFHTHDLGVASDERARITKDGKFGIGVQSPFSRFQSGGHTFSGGNGMYSNDRVGMSNHGQLTGLMLASTYNDGAHPEYGLVFVQGPNTSSYNVWGVCPDGPNKGNSLNFHYAPQATNIHSPGYRKFQMTGDGYFLQSSQPAFRVGRSSSYTSNAGNVIVFNSTSGAGRFNQGSHYNTSNGRFTAPVTGRYMFTAHVIYQGVGNGQDMTDCWTIQMNNSVVGYSGRRGEYIANETGNGGYYTDWNTFILNMSANDFVEIVNARTLQVHGNAAYTTFAGYLIG